jgi:hypothetical protein
VWVPISSTNTPGIQNRCGLPPCATGFSRTRLFLLLPFPTFFSAPTEASYRPAERHFAHRNPQQHGKQELCPLGVSSPRPLLEIIGEQLRGFLV